MKGKINQFIVILLTHFLIYPVYLEDMSRALQQLAVFGSITIYIFFNFNRIRPLYQSLVNQKKVSIVSIAFISILISASFLIPIIYNTNDFSYFNHVLGTFIYIFFYIILVALIRAYFSESEPKIKMLEIVSLVQRNYVITTLVFLMLPNLKMWWANIIYMTPRQMELIQEPRYITRVSWDGYAGFTSTVYSTIAVIISIYLIIEFYKKYRKINHSYLFTLFMSLIGNTFYGRAGLLVSLVMVSIGVIYLVILYKQYRLFYSIIGSIITLFILITLISNFNDTVATWYNWAMEPILSLLETGEIQTRSTNILWDMWFIPDFKTLLIGDGYYTSPGSSQYYMNTDVGFLRPILFFGVFFTILYYLIPIIIGSGITSKKDKNTKLLVSMLFLSIFLLEIKGEVVFKFLPILSMLFVATYVKQPVRLKQNQLEKNFKLGVETNEYYLD